MQLDVLILGGGGAGLWLLDELHRRGFGVLLVEACVLGAGQTITSQGIIHGGVKYTLSGLLTESAEAIKDMPPLWRECLSGRREPDLRETRIWAECCYLWRTENLRAKLGMVGARAGLRSRVGRVSDDERPAGLASCPGDVFRVDEQVIDTASFIRNFAQRHSSRILRSEGLAGVEFVAFKGQVDRVLLEHPKGTDKLEIRPHHVVLAAGEGNGALRSAVGLSEKAMQRRPLHMVMVRGDLPALYGHCVDGGKTRVTITTAADSHRRTVWQLGGQVAEVGVDLSGFELVRFAQRELEAILPGVNFDGAEWGAYRVDRAEARMAGGMRPAGPTVRKEGNTITAWPTKFALVPRLTQMIVERLGDPAIGVLPQEAVPMDWPRPEVAMSPWEKSTQWHGSVKS